MGDEGTSRTRNKFYLTEATTSDKIVRSARLEEIRMTIIDSILNEFPESGTGFNYGAKVREGRGWVGRGGERRANTCLSGGTTGRETHTYSLTHSHNQSITCAGLCLR
jgi:hypothetical protein